MRKEDDNGVTMIITRMMKEEGDVRKLCLIKRGVLQRSLFLRIPYILYTVRVCECRRERGSMQLCVLLNTLVKRGIGACGKHRYAS